MLELDEVCGRAGGTCDDALLPAERNGEVNATDTLVVPSESVSLIGGLCRLLEDGVPLKVLEFRLALKFAPEDWLIDPRVNASVEAPALPPV